MSEVDAVLAFLAMATAINFALIAHLWGRESVQTDAPRDLLFPAGARLAEMSGENRAGASVRIGTGDTAYVFVFLSIGCPKCRAVAGDVTSAARRSANRGVELWIVTADGLTAADLDTDPALDAHVLDLTGVTYTMLNPRRASPAYLFVAPDLVVQAGGFVGDDDWRAFATQLAEAG